MRVIKNKLASGVDKSYTYDSHLIGVTVKGHTYNLIKRAAEREGLAMATWIRRVVMQRLHDMEIPK